MKRFLHISIVWRTEEKSVDQLRPIFDLANEWICYGGSNWIVYTEDETYIWQGRMRAITNTTDSFFICEIANIEGSGGWLPKWAWDWIKRNRESPSYFAFPPS